MGVVAEDVLRHLAPVNEARHDGLCHCFSALSVVHLLHVVMLEGVVVEAPSAQGVAELAVDDGPRREHCLLVGIAEIREDRGDAVDALLHVHLVGGTRQGTDALARLQEHLFGEQILDLVELRLGETCRHKLGPGRVVDERGKVVDAQFTVLVVNLGAIDQERDTDGHGAQHGHGLAFAFHLLLVALLLLRLLRLVLAGIVVGGAVVGVVGFGSSTLIVGLLSDVDGGLLSVTLGGSDMIVYPADDIKLAIAHLQELVLIVDAVVGVATRHGTLDIDLLELDKHVVRLVGVEAAALEAFKVAELQEAIHGLLLFLMVDVVGLLALVFRVVGEQHLAGRIDDDAQRTVGREVEDIALSLGSAVEVGMGLHPEDGLHVGGGSGVLRPLEVEHGGPFRHRDTRGQAATAQRDGVGIDPDVLLHLLKRLLGKLVDAVAGNVDDLKVLENRMIIQERLHRLALPHAGQNPKGVAKLIAEFLTGEGIDAVGGVADELIEEAVHLILKDKPAHHLLGRQLAPEIVAHTVGPSAEERRELEVLILVEHVVFLDLRGEVEGEDIDLGQHGIGIGITIIVLVPIALGFLLLHIVPSVDFALLEVVEQIEGGPRQRQDAGGGLFQRFQHVLAAFGLCALVSLIDDDILPVVIENVAFQLIVVLAAHLRG